MWKLPWHLSPALVTVGCVLSMDAVITESESMFDARLLGAWQEVGGSDRAVVSTAGDGTYAIEYTTDGSVGRFEARLGRLGGHLVLDVLPAPREEDLPEPYSMLLVTGHVLFALEVTEDEIRMATLDPDSLQAALGAGQVPLHHTIVGDRLVLHGNPRELRSALGAYLSGGGVLDESILWRRRETTGLVTQPVEIPCFESAAWREADDLFRGDGYWMGADVASTVDLGGDRILWLFGDTWIDPSGAGTRQGARMVSNSVAIQTGRSPVTASITFHWGRAEDGVPDALFPDRGGESLWFGNGVRLEDRLLLFFSRVLRGTGGGLGFESVGWTALMVENPDAEPGHWRVRTLATPPNPLGVLVGFAGVVRLDEYVYALGSQDPVKSHPIFAARWSVEDARKGDLLHPEWWAGERLGWVPDSSSAPRHPLIGNGQSELSIHVDEATGRFLAVHTQGFGPADVVMRAAPALTGPWSSPRLVYRPPEYYRPNVMIYAGKAHPELTGADLVLTYATNTFKGTEHLSDRLIYYPRFVRLSRCR